jgi:hypothetical protein
VRTHHPRGAREHALAREAPRNGRAWAK